MYPDVPTDFEDDAFDRLKSQKIDFYEVSDLDPDIGFDNQLDRSFEYGFEETPNYFILKLTLVP